MKRIALVLLALVAAVGCVVAAVLGGGSAAGAIETQAEASRLEAEADKLEAESVLVDSRSVSYTQAALVEIAAAAIVNADTARSEAAGRADRIQGEYHQLVIESIRDRRRSWWPWVLVAVVAATAVGVVLQSRRRPVQVVVIRLNGDGVECVQLPASTGSDLIPAVLRPQRRSIRRVGGYDG